MKKTFYMILAAFACHIVPADAQQFLNGSMEPAGTVTTCSDEPKAGFNANMGNVWDAGEALKIYLANNSCGVGTAQAGNYFTLMRYSVFNGGNLLIFKLDGDLIVNQPYKIAMKYSTPTPTAIGNLRYGYGKDSVSFDTLSGTIPNIVSTIWKADTVSFVPKKAWRYIWMEVSTLQGFSYDLAVDQLSLIKVSTAGVDEVDKSNAVRVFPNPVRDVINISLDDHVQLPCSMQLFDIAGKELLRRDITTRTATISDAQLAPGMYFIRLADKTRSVYTTKLMAE